jgi:hypothetical protein
MEQLRQALNHAAAVRAWQCRQLTVTNASVAYHVRRLVFADHPV